MARRRAPGRHSRSSGGAAVRLRLDNGLQLVMCPRPQLSHAHVSLMFGIGSRHETQASNGITHVLEHMLFRGSGPHVDATALNAAAEDFGGFLDGATYRDHLAFATDCHPTAVGSAVRILGDLVRKPRYRAMDVERAILREELLETLDATGRMVDLDAVAHRTIFGDHGLGLPIEGTLENLAAVERDDLDAHREKHLVGVNSVMTIAGPLDPERIQRQVERALGKLPRGEQLGSEPPQLEPHEPVLRFVRDAASQVDIRVSFPAAIVTDPGYPALLLLARLLADGLSSRMHAELVDRQGLAYSLHAGLITYQDCARFEFEVSVAPNRASQALQAILDFARRASRFRYTDKEIKRARRRYRFNLEFMDDSPADLATWHGLAALYGVEQEVHSLGGRLSRVDDTELRRAARNVFRPEGLVVAAVGELARGELTRMRRILTSW